MNTNEEILDLLLKRDLLLQRVSNGLSKEIASQYIKMIDEAINSLGKVDISLINMNKIIKEINSNIGLDYANVEDNFNEVAITEASFIPKAINGIVAVDIMNKTLPDSLVNKIVKNSILSDGLLISESFNALNEKTKKIFQGQIRLGVLNGNTSQEIISNIKPFINDITENKLRTLVKTSISTVINNTRMDTYRENESIFKGYQWHATLDSRVRIEHLLLDGATWDLNGKGTNDKGKKYYFRNSPAGWNCRCILLPITKSYKELGLDIEEIPAGTRSSMDGYVASTLKASDWFEKKGSSFQKEYLGEKRYSLFKEGKITLSDLVSQKGRVLTVEELRKLS